MDGEPVIRLDADLVNRHAGTVAGLSDDLSVVRGAVKLGMDPQAYGYLCRFLPALLESVFGPGLDALDGEAEALAETAVNLRTATAAIQGTDARGGAAVAAVVQRSPQA